MFEITLTLLACSFWFFSRALSRWLPRAIFVDMSRNLL